MADYALTIVALRRVGRELAAVPVPVADVARVVPPMPRPSGWSWRLQVGGAMTATALALVLVVPQLGLGGGGSLGDTAPATRVQPTERWRAAEAHVASFPDNPSYAAEVPLRHYDSNGRPRAWKEVPRPDAMPRGARAW